MLSKNIININPNLRKNVKKSKLHTVIWTPIMSMQSHSANF